MVMILITLLTEFIVSILHRTLVALLYLTATYATLHRLGFVQRLIHFLAERQLSKEANGTKITMANIEVDIIRGRAVVTDLVVHSPQRGEWEWDSPLIARAGKIEAYFNLISTIDHIGPFLGFPVKDIYSVTVSDVQVFVEKRRNVFNFHLLDPSLDLPDAADVMESIRESERLEAAEGGGEEGGGAVVLSAGANLSDGQLAAVVDSRGPTGLEDAADAPLGRSAQPVKPQVRSDMSIRAETKANELVTHMLGAVSSLGRAANEGGKDALHLALLNHKDGFVNQLKKLRTENGTSVEGMATEGMRVFKHVGRMVEKNVSDIREQVDSFKPPTKKPGFEGKVNEDLFRIGRLVLREARVFTKDLITMGGRQSSSSSSAATTTSVGSAVGTDDLFASAASDGSAVGSVGTTGGKRPRRAPNATGWSKPMLIKEMLISSAEFCPPMSLRDAQGLPAIGQTIDEVVDVLVKRLVAEMAKTNSGRLLQTAFGEVFAWMEDKGGG